MGTLPIHRWRTWLRSHSPWWLIERGWFEARGDCADHEFYRVDEKTWGCYHCAKRWR